jgi:hypothetical protein
LIFSYHIFDNVKWINPNPWEYQEIYNTILEMIQIYELNIHSNLDLDDLYDENENNNSDFYKSNEVLDIDENLNPDELEFKNKVLNIINKTNNIKL